MKRLIYILTFLICLLTSVPAFAVTEKEMDHARAIAAKAYLRYANDGSGYLDNVNPRSMAELEKALKAKEKENIKAFKNIAVPKDYASWDKQKLIDYWSVTAFSAKGLIEKGRIGKSRARKNLNAMTVASPSQPEKTESQKTDTPTKQDAQSNQAKESAAGSTLQAPTTQAPADTQDSTVSATPADPLSDPLFADSDPDQQLTKAEDHTWVYIIILCILVGVVVALVVFASNVMKKNGEKYSRRAPIAPNDNDNPALSSADTTALREKFAATLSAKNEEISALSRKVESLNNQNNSLKSNLEGLTAEVTSLRGRISEANKKIAEYEATLQSVQNAASRAKTAIPHAEVPEPRHEAVAQQPINTNPQQPQPVKTPSVRSIFLGRANAKGIFVRADRTLNPGNTIFRLDTTDGYAGSFRVVSNPTVWEMAMLTPMESLAGACVAPDITNTDGMSKVVNDSAGTAIFEGGCWKVIRKAKIHFE